MATRAAGKQDPAGSRNGNPALDGEAPADGAADRPPAQRGPRAPADGRVRGAGGIPGAGRVAQARPARSSARTSPRSTEMVAAIESDVALVIAVMRLANKRADGRGRVRSIPQAIEVLTPAGVEALIGATKTFDFFERTPAVGRGARALPPARGRDAARGGPALLADRVPRPRRAAGHLAAARHRQARAGAGLSRATRARSTRPPARPSSASTPSAASSASTTRSSAA